MNRLKLKIGTIITVGIFLPLLLLLKTDTLFGGDAGDLVTAAFVRGVAHPPGYPLYTFLGYLLTKLPFSTVAGRVTLLSTIPAIVSVTILFGIVFMLTKKLLAALIAALSFGFTYLFLLLAIIPEVFGLHVLFVTTLTLLLFVWKQTKNNRFFSAFIFTFALSLTHHQTILFLAPAFAYFVYINRSLLPRNSKFYILNSIYFLFGLLPYLYVYFAARANPVINWENPQTITGFARLVTRAIYGTFQSGRHIADTFQFRLLQVRLFFETLLIDVTWVGIILGALGLLFLFFKNRQQFIFIVLAFFFAGPFFVYYAAFPFHTNFFLGTIERFYLMPYVFFFVFVGFGVVAVEEFGRRLFQQLFRNKKQYPISVLFLLLPLLLAITTIPKVLPLKDDQTAEELAHDVLITPTGDSVLLLTEDTRLFDTQYLYYTEPDMQQQTRLIQFGMLGFPHYQAYLADVYPELAISDEPDPLTHAVRFVEENADQFTFYAEVPYQVGDAFQWIPVGMLYRLYRADDELPPRDYLKENTALFAQYHDPLEGALSSFTHVMLADVLRVYGNARRDVGKALVALGLYEDALPYFTQALRYQPALVDNYIELMNVHLQLANCKQGEKILHQIERDFAEDARVYSAGAILYRACFNDEQKAAEYELLFVEKSQSAGLQLDQI